MNRKESSRKLSAHIGYLFTELPLMDRIAAARAAGFHAIEHPHPFAINAVDMRSALQDSGLRFSQLAAGMGDSAKGEKGLAALPGREADFREAVQRAIDYAGIIGCPLLHPMAGVPRSDDRREEVRATYVSNLRFTVQEAEAAGLCVLVEPISHEAVPGYFASSMGIVLDAIQEAAANEIRILLDTFHAGASEFDTCDFIRRNSSRIAHVHVADYPGRHEPGTGTCDFRSFLETLDAFGYSGGIGFEYVPAAATSEGLTWLADPMWHKSIPSADAQLNSRKLI